MDTKKFIDIVRSRYSELLEREKKLPINIYRNIIATYFSYVKKPSFNILVEDYKLNYIFNESRVEKNISYEEILGLGDIYDYINLFDFKKDKFNIFTTSLILHMKLYSHCVGSEFGGKLRTSQAILFDSNIEVVDYLEAQKIFNSYISKSDEIFKPLDEGNLFEYIDNCIALDVNLIKLQPFADGNKRVFRSILNLLFKRINLPPVYIDVNERNIYKEALHKAMKTGNNDDIIEFYYKKMCDTIIYLDLYNSKLSEQSKNKVKLYYRKKD